MKTKIIALILTLCVLSLGSLCGCGNNSNNSTENVNFKSIKSNEDRIEFLSQYGWEVNPDAIENSEYLIPSEFDAVYLKYNQIQKAQSLDLEKYKNKTVQRYTYKITNYPDYNDDVYANLLIYKNNVVGGDICSAALDGFMHGFDQSNKPTW